MVVTDTSFVETAVFGARAGIELGPGVERWLRSRSRRYRAVFFLEPVADYATSATRMESEGVAGRISREVQDAYRHYGYQVVHVPPMGLEERCRFVARYIHKGGAENVKL